jgi:hypothetical protein
MLVLIPLDASRVRLNVHISTVLGLSSVLWSGHIVHASIPVFRGRNPSLIIGPSGSSFDKDNHVILSTYGAGQAILSFSLNVKSD